MLLLHLVYLRIRGLELILIHLLITLLEVLSGMLGVGRRLRSRLRRLLPGCQSRASEVDEMRGHDSVSDSGKWDLPVCLHSSISNMDEYSIDHLDPILGN